MAKRDDRFHYIHLPDGAGWFKLKKDGTRWGVHAYDSGINIFEYIARSNGSHVMGEFNHQEGKRHGLASIEPDDLVCITARRYEYLKQVETEATRELAELRKELDTLKEGTE